MSNSVASSKRESSVGIGTMRRVVRPANRMEVISASTGRDPARPNAIEQGREAVARRAWARAFRAFARADRARPLGPQDLEHLAVAAYMLGRNDDHLDCMKRAHRAHQHARNLPRAARCAFWAGINLAVRGQASHAAGWFGRAQRLAEADREIAWSTATCWFPRY